jgi:hypothetical protein
MIAGYMILLLGFMATGWMIPVNRWSRAYRTSRILDYGRISYGNFSNTYNGYHEIQGFGKALGSIFKPFGGSSKSSGGKKGGGLAILLLIVLIIVALIAGALITATIIKHVAASQPLPPFDEAMRNRDLKGANVEALESMSSAADT